MSGEVEELKQIAKEYMKELRDIEDIRIIFARNLNAQWKIVIKYATPDNPDTMSMLIINLTTKKVDTFREGVLTY